MKKRFVSVVLAVFVCISFSGCALQKEAKESQIAKYTLYIGLNDKDTYTQKISYEEAEKKVSSIALKYADGFTELSAKGAYKDDKGVVTHENSLVMVFYNTTDRQMESIMGEVLTELNQESILIEKQQVSSRFYEGVKP